MEHVKQTLRKIQSMENMVNNPAYQLEKSEEYKLQIKVDNKVAHGAFLPDLENPGRWKASEQTFRAMKKDIFALGDSIDELKEPYTCASCKSNLDKQFWHFCPYCGEQFLE